MARNCGGGDNWGCVNRELYQTSFFQRISSQRDSQQNSNLLNGILYFFSPTKSSIRCRCGQIYSFAEVYYRQAKLYDN